MPRSLDNKKAQARYEDDVLKAAKRWYHEQNELRKQQGEKYVLSPRGQDLLVITYELLKFEGGVP